jgi:hypothetical protein
VSAIHYIKLVIRYRNALLCLPFGVHTCQRRQNGQTKLPNGKYIIYFGSSVRNVQSIVCMTVGGDVALAGAADSGRIDWPVRQAMMISASL